MKRAGKKKRTLVILAALAVLCLIGCGNAAENDSEEMQIKETENHLAVWQKELPKDTGFGGLSDAAVRGMEVQKDGTVVLAVSYEPREEKDSFDYWDISVPYQSTVTVNTEELYDLFGTVVMLGGTKAEAIRLEDAGLSDTKTFIFLAYVKDQTTGEKGAAEPDTAKTILIGNQDGQGNYYAAADGSDEVFLVNQLLLDSILGLEPYQYILKIPVLINVDTVEKIRIAAGEEVHIMEQGKEVWKLDQETVTQKEFHTLYGELLDVRIAGEIDKHTDLGEDRTPILSLQFFRSVEGASDVEVNYYEYDEEFLRVSVNGQEFFLAERTDVEEIMEKLGKS